MTGSPRAPAAAGRGAQGAAAPDGRADAQGGAATLIALALFAIVVMAVLVAVDLGALAGARAQAQTAADLAALAAVTPSGGVPPAERAREIAAANGARMTRCICGPMEAVIGVRRRVRLVPFGVAVEVRADARAVLPGTGAAVAARSQATTPSSRQRPAVKQWAPLGPGVPRVGSQRPNSQPPLT